MRTGEPMAEPRYPITIRVLEAEHAAMKSAAREIGLTLSAWLRMVGLDAVKRANRDLKRGR